MATNTLDQSRFMLVQKNQPLHDSVRQALENYIAQLQDDFPVNLYQLVLAEVEAPLMESVMQYTRNNQSRAAVILGLSRGTLRKKLKLYGIFEKEPVEERDVNVVG